MQKSHGWAREEVHPEHPRDSEKLSQARDWKELHCQSKAVRE